jgi:hypothetical protein
MSHNAKALHSLDILYFPFYRTFLYSHFSSSFYTVTDLYVKYMTTPEVRTSGLLT